MNIIKYILFKSYRNKIDEVYSKELCNKFMFEEKQLEKIYAFYINNGKV